LNNAGYTVERFIHGPEQEYNDINAGISSRIICINFRLGVYFNIEDLRREKVIVVPSLNQSRS